jgi:hypothetical protein
MKGKGIQAELCAQLFPASPYSLTSTISPRTAKPTPATVYIKEQASPAIYKVHRDRQLVRILKLLNML